MRDGGSRCEAHRMAGKKAADQRRGSASERGYTWAWQKARLRFLKSHPLCAACEKVGRVEPAEVVDHIVPHRGDISLFWDEDNWQALSKRCHDIKTAREDGGFGR